MKRIKKIKSYQLPIDITQEGEHFIAACRIWPDCYAQGNTIDEATSEIIAVAASLIELYQEENLSIPLPQQRQSHLKTSTKLSFNVPIFASA